MSRKHQPVLPVDKRTFDELRDELRKSLLPYLRRAFNQIQPISRPHILDIGCGSGVPTLELARLSNGEVTALDTDGEALQRLNTKIRQANLEDQVHIIEKSMTQMDFPNESFDILWAEGSTFVIGFKNALKSWKRFLKPNGYFVVHDEAENLEKKLHDVTACGYRLVDWFSIGDDIWWLNYYEPLNREIQQIHRSNPTDPELKAALKRAKKEIQGYQKFPWRYRSVYFIMQKPDPSS